MASELARMTPLYGLFHLAELYWSHFELPNNNHLVVTTRGEVLSIVRELHDVHGRSMTTLQIILMLGFVQLR